ncbi:MAG: hypothetical protein KA187_03885, partial [Arenimonas sp.]|nr:hypothetical protein [Arenimonas sp.]
AARNLANAVGTALSGALVVGLLGANIQRQVEQHPLIPASLIAQVNLDRPAFLNNEQLDAVVAKTTATPAQAEVAAQINADARLRSLKLALMFLAGLSLLMIVPAGGLPGAVGWPATRPVSSSGTP